jgi:aldose sugar dehydrogenase
VYNIKLLFYSFAIILIPLSSNYSSVYFSCGAYSKDQPSPDGPTISDDGLSVEKVTPDLTFPTSMTFVGNNDILVTEKNTGRVMRVLDGQVQDSPLLNLSIASKIER